MRTLLLYCLLFSFALSSCRKKEYTCICKDSIGDEHIKTGSYVGNDPDEYLVIAENQLKSKHNYSSCRCKYN
jgi:hypothetical protein